MLIVIFSQKSNIVYLETFIGESGVAAAAATPLVANKSAGMLLFHRGRATMASYYSVHMSRAKGMLVVQLTASALSHGTLSLINQELRSAFSQHTIATWYSAAPG